MGQGTSELKDTLEKIVKELYDVRESINELKKESLDSNEDYKSSSEFYKEIVNSLIKSNVELHAKISELVVVINGLSKDLRELLNIFKEAALAYMEEKPSSKSKDLEKKIEEVEGFNKNILEVLNKLTSELEELKKEKEKKEEKSIKRPLPPPPPMPPMYGLKRAQDLNNR